MSGESEDRTTELENRIDELEATVRGLTDELVDRTQRIRVLEQELGIVAGASTQPIITAGESDDTARESAPETEPARDDAPEPTEDGGSDMIVPEPEDDAEDEDEVATAGPEMNADTGGEESDSADSEGASDDIIVA